LRLARGLQNKVLEALAAGLPVVVTPAVWAGLPPEALPSCELAESAGDFAKALIPLLLTSPEERRQRAKLARLDQLTWSNRFSAIETIIGKARR
jgi:acyl-CoA reductase-like NAD-dependent aldehyde dehydrogenase